MFEVSILIPLADNAGLTFDESHHATFEAKALALFEGFTREANEAVGGWMDAGTVYRDSLRVYTVAVRSIVDGGKVGELASFAKVHYIQIAVFVRYLGLSEIL